MPSRFGPDSMTWRLNRERIVLLAGPAAAILQAAHPQVAMGVARHSRFREDTAGRLARTLDAVYAVAFGTEDSVEAVRARVAAAHRPVRGTSPESYSAFDPGAQRWVLATLMMGSISIYRRFVCELSEDELDRFVSENQRFGEVFGLAPELAPATWCELDQYWSEMMDSDLLGSHPLCGEVARAVLKPSRPWGFRMGSPLWSALAAEWIGPELSQRLGLPTSRLRAAVWGTLDRLLPRALPRLPDRVRYAPAFLEARKRDSALP